MDLAKEVIYELQLINLNGATITSVDCSPNETRISFTLGDAEIFFVARNEAEYAITSVAHGGQVFNDPQVLNQYEAWVKYVTSVVHPIVERKRREIAEKAYRANVDTLKPQEDAIITTGEHVSTARLDEAEARGRKEGFKAARQKNAKEMKALKRKYNIILGGVVGGLILVFVLIWFLFLRNSDNGVLDTDPYPPPLGEGYPTDNGIHESDRTQNNNYMNGDESNNNGTAVEQPPISFGLEEDFTFDNLEMNFQTPIEWLTVENDFADEHDGETAFRIPISITNLSDVVHQLHFGYVMQHGPDNNILIPFNFLFEGDILDAGPIEPGETLESHMHFQFAGDGEYFVVFNNGIDQNIEVRFSVEQEA